MKIFSSIIALLLWTLTVTAQNLYTKTTQVGLGSTGILDTYLSQEKFSDMGLTVLSTSEKQKREDSPWTTMREHEVNISMVSDRSGNRDETHFGYNFFYGRQYKWKMGRRLQLQAGGMLNTEIGAIYNTSNTNNPVNARLSMQLMPTGTAAYDITLWRRTLRLRYEAQLPLAGFMFSPNYGQSYYEMFSLGNYDHNVVATSFVNAPTWRQQLSAEYPVTRRLTLRIGYLGHYQQSHVNNLKTHIYNHRFMIGIVKNVKIIKL
jgi:hypothetical protein